jgi:hypothetical protein
MKLDNTALVSGHVAPGYLVVRTRGANGNILWNGVWLDR